MAAALADLVAALPKPVSWATRPSPSRPSLRFAPGDSPAASSWPTAGVARDGHAFVPQALERGAVAVVAERDLPEVAEEVPLVVVPSGREALAYLSAAWLGFPARRLTVVGVTGTDGKTTTCNLLYAILVAAGRRTGLVSTVNAVIGEQVFDTGLHTTTPDSPDVQRYLAEMVAGGHGDRRAGDHVARARAAPRLRLRFRRGRRDQRHARAPRHPRQPGGLPPGQSHALSPPGSRLPQAGRAQGGRPECRRRLVPLSAAHPRRPAPGLQPGRRCRRRRDGHPPRAGRDALHGPGRAGRAVRAAHAPGRRLSTSPTSWRRPASPSPWTCR